MIIIGTWACGIASNRDVEGHAMFLLLALTLCQDKIVKVENEWKGTTSRIETLEFQRCLTLEEWRTLWERHTGNGVKVPEVNFDKSMIVAAFFGRRASMKWPPSIEGVKEGQDGIQIEVLGKVETNPIEKVDYRPYLILQVPKFRGKLSIRAMFSPFVAPNAQAEIGRKEFEAISK
jgi:hypothetical protein